MLGQSIGLHVFKIFYYDSKSPYRNLLKFLFPPVVHKNALNQYILRSSWKEKKLTKTRMIT